MPTVKQTKMCLGLDPARPYQETIVYTKYDNGHHEPEGGRFYISLPRILIDSLGQDDARGKTQDKAFEAFEECLERFKNLKTEQNRVILFRIDVSPEKYRYSSPVGYEVKIWAGTYEEMVAISGNGEKRYSYQKVESSLNFPGEERTDRRGDKFKCQVPWTEKNEAFFKWIGDRMAELIAAVNELDDPVKMIETINTGKLLPLGRQPA